MLAAEQALEGFGLFGVIKETGVDDEGLMDFMKVFPEALYRDEELVLYKAMGDNRLSVSGMLFGMVFRYKKMKEMNQRLKEKNLEGNLKGEGLKQGGIIIFDKSGSPVYSFAEETGQDLPIEEIVGAVMSVRNAQK